jgi:hypothetical protein
MTVTNLSRSTSRWSREQIRAARMAPLAPLLQRRALQLVERPAGNFELAAYKGLLLKDSYWRWPERDRLAMPLTSSSKFSAYRSTMPCAKSPASKNSKQPLAAWRYDPSAAQATTVQRYNASSAQTAHFR